MSAEADWTKLWDMIKDIKYGMFAAERGNGHLHSRPMTTLDSRDQRQRRAVVLHVEGQ